MMGPLRKVACAEMCDRAVLFKVRYWVALTMFVDTDKGQGSLLHGTS